MVERKAVALRTLSPGELVRELERLRPPGPAVLCFDGDGTLWSGDVGEDLFELALERELLREPARAALEREAAAAGLSPGPTPSATARALYDAYLAGRYPERDVYGMMTWCYAGYTHAELVELSRAALTKTGISARLNRELEPILEYARSSALRTIVVSASPRCVVEEAASLWSFPAEDVAASTPRSENGVVAPELLHPVPYAETKCTIGRELTGDAIWLASFGDNVFDLDMLLGSKLGVAVQPKLPLRTRLLDLPGVVLLA